MNEEIRSFRKNVGKIAVPVTLQSILQSSFSIVDELMLGQLGESSIAAVGIGGNLMLILSVVIGGIGTIAGILISQFIGAKEEREAWGGFSVSMLAGLLASAVFMAVGLSFSDKILALYTEEAQTAQIGAAYLRIVSLAFVPMAVITVLCAWLRCCGHAALPLAAGFAAVVCNTALNYILIFGRLGFSPLGARGAAYATVAAQLFQLILLLLGFAYCLKKDGKKMQFCLRMKKLTPAQYLLMLAPILVNEFLWSLGQNVNSAVYGHLGTDSLAAYTLTTPIQGFFTGALCGISAAAGVIIGKRLGAGDYGGAYSDSKRLLWLGLFGSLALSAVLTAFAGCYVRFYSVDASVQETAKYLLIAFAAYAPVKVLNMILGGGIIRSGGDTKIIMIIDTIGTWAVGIPLCLFAAYGLGLPILWVYVILSVEEIVRLGAAFAVFRRKKWMKNLAAS